MESTGGGANQFESVHTWKLLGVCMLQNTRQKRNNGEKNLHLEEQVYLLNVSSVEKTSRSKGASSASSMFPRSLVQLALIAPPLMQYQTLDSRLLGEGLSCVCHKAADALMLP